MAVVQGFVSGCRLRNWLKILCNFLSCFAVALIASKFAHAQNDQQPPDEPKVLTVAHPLEDIDAIAAFFLIPWAGSISNASGNELDIQFVPASPDGSIGEIARIENGEISGAWVRLSDLKALFPSVETFELPFLASLSPEANSVATWRFGRKYITPMRKDLHFVAIHTYGAGVLHTRARRMNGPEKFEGLVAQAPTGPARDLISQLGGTAKDIPFVDVPRAMARKQIEGTIAPWHQFSYGPILKEVGKHMVPGLEKALTTESYALVLDQRAVRRLPENLRAIVRENSGESASALAGRAVAFGTEVGRANLTRARRSEIILVGDDLAPLQNAARTVIANWLTQRTDQGFPAREWLREFSKILADSR